ncbi:MAG: helix-turn-helix transcriptional regulator [Acidobacteria bacterium]|nr:helix-turn-helix transcriptional regulator [Acidobacteriota bacterium]
MATTPAAPPLELDTIHDGPAFRLRDYRCRMAPAARGAEEASRAHEIVFVRTGLFVLEAERGRAVADPNHVVFFNAGEPYRVSHPLPGGDDNLVLTLPVEDLLDVLSHRDPSCRERPNRPFRFTDAPATPRAALLQRRLLTSAKGGTGGLELEEAAFDLAYEAVSGADAPGSMAGTPRRARTARDHRDAVEAVKILVSARLADPPSLREIARVVGYAPFHLARIFRREAGLPIHRYLVRLRLRVALERLARDGADLTGLALDLGFSDHSHFTNAFRREFGATPSGLRALVGWRGLREAGRGLPA